MQRSKSDDEDGAEFRFLTFFLCWADVMGWVVPDVHIRAVRWLATRGDNAVLMCFRGFSKSSLLAIYNAWRYSEDHTYRILHQGDQDGTAYKTSRDTKRVLMRHPMTKRLSFIRGESSFWWVPGADDERNPSMQAAGIMSNITSSRADEVQNDDVEVPKNIRTPEARETLRYRLGEQTHILVPGGRRLFVGTPHTHDSLYDEMRRGGADCLVIRMYGKEHRIEASAKTIHAIPFVPDVVFSGVGASAALLVEGRDYVIDGQRIEFTSAPTGVIDLYADSAWPERFTDAEMLRRRKETRTLNEWDSQYQLHSKPVSDVRLDPARIKAYDVHPTIEPANKTVRMMLGSAQIASARANWDCATGKAKGDASAFSLILDDVYGNSYWHVCTALTGDFAEFDDSKNTHIRSGQVMQAVELIKRYNIPTVIVETNGVGSFVGKLLMRALAQEEVRCSVKEQYATGNKNERILAGLEPLIESGVLWAHVDVLNGPLWDQMRDWNPDITNQPDDYLDSGAGAALAAPVRIGQMVRNLAVDSGHHWQQNTGVFEVELEV